jgi:hypothetical protein
MTFRIRVDDKQHQAQGKGRQGLGAVEFLVAHQQGDDLYGHGGDGFKRVDGQVGGQPAAMTTIMVSPMARETASSTPPTMPGRAAGRTTWRMVSDLVAPRP